METQKSPLKQIAINYGMLLALLSIGLSVVVYVTDNHLERPWWASLLSFLIMVYVLVAGLKFFRKNNDNFLSLGESLKVGLAISLIAGIIVAIFNYIFTTLIEPDFVNQMLEVTRENMIATNPEMTQEQMDMAMGISEKMMQPGIMVAIAIVITLFFGFIISLVSGLIMQRKRPEIS